MKEVESQFEQPLSQTNPVKAVCPGSFQVKDGTPTIQIPFCCSHNIFQTDPSLRKAVMVIHGALRNADEYFDHMESAAQMAGAKAQGTMILAPQFLAKVDVDEHNLDERIVYWNEQSWKQGYRSENRDTNPDLERISSFRVLDAILEHISDRKISPNLERIVVAGHSAGGQFVNRFAAGSQIEELLNKRRIKLRFIVANPSSYLYFDAQRRVPGETMRFELPDINTNPGYNNYHYGLDNLNTYMLESGPENIALRYASKEVIYLLGGEDNDPDSDMLDKEPPAMLQGAYRLERGLVYFNYLKQLFGERLNPAQSVHVIEGVGHDHTAIFQSEIARQFIFE